MMMVLSAMDALPELLRRTTTFNIHVCVQTGAVQWSDTISSFSTCAAYIILVSVFLVTAAALFVEVTRNRPPALQQPLVTSPSASCAPSSSAQLLSRLSLQVTSAAPSHFPCFLIHTTPVLLLAPPSRLLLHCQIRILRRFLLTRHVACCAPRASPHCFSVLAVSQGMQLQPCSPNQCDPCQPPVLVFRIWIVNRQASFARWLRVVEL
jgi:hypothetical protein